MKRDDHVTHMDVSQLMIRPSRRNPGFRNSGRRSRPVLPA